MTKEFDINDAREITGGYASGSIVTRDGCPARIVCWDAVGNYPIIALVDISYAGEYPYRYTKDGKTDIRPNVKSNLDLMISAPRKWRVRFVTAFDNAYYFEAEAEDIEEIRERFSLESPAIRLYTIEEI